MARGNNITIEKAIMAFLNARTETLKIEMKNSTIYDSTKTWNA